MAVLMSQSLSICDCSLGSSKHTVTELCKASYLIKSSGNATWSRAVYTALHLKSVASRHHQRVSPLMTVTCIYLYVVTENLINPKNRERYQEFILFSLTVQINKWRKHCLWWPSVKKMSWEPSQRILISALFCFVFLTSPSSTKGESGTFMLIPSLNFVIHEYFGWIGGKFISLY